MAIPDVDAANALPLRPAHLSDPALAPFLQPSFDPAAYLNAALPPLSLYASLQSSKQPVLSASATLATLSSHTQTLLSQLSTHASRLSTILSQLTDDILRSGARLAYEVDVLRGETIGLSELLTQGLQRDVRSFVADGLVVTRLSEGPGNTTTLEATSNDKTEPPQGPTTAEGSTADANGDTPPYITQLRLLAQVRTRLESVIQVFGEAMQWTLPPSEISLASSLISVSGPEPGSDSHSREEKGREFAERLRNEIADLVASSDQTSDGYDIAMARIQALRELAQVWKGTAEEKARVRFVEGLVRIAEDHHRARNKDAISRRQRDSRVNSPQPRADDRPRTEERSHGFLENLQRLRGGIYLE